MSEDDLIAEGLRLQHAGQIEAAAELYQKILARQPRHGRARNLLGMALYQKGDSAGAIEQLERATKQEPGLAAIFINLGGVYLEVGRSEDAARACRAALKLNPDSPQASFNLGHALRDLRDWEGAAIAYENYIRLRPADGLGHGALGDTMKERGQYDAAMASFELAMTYSPYHPGAYLGIADLMIRKGWTKAALVVLEKIDTVTQNDPETLFRSAELKMLLGDLCGSWDEFDERRFLSKKSGFARRPTPPPYWTGEDMTGKSILIWNEQGVGDETLYANALPDVIAKAKRCVIACSRRMAPIFARSFSTAEVRIWNGVGSAVHQGDSFDFQCAIGSLGRYLRRDFSNFPTHAGYLQADPTIRERLRRKYESLASGRRIVGLSWKSKHKILGGSKSADLARLEAILSTPNTMFVNLQYGDCATEIADVRERLGVEIYEDPEIDALANMDAFFAQVAALDLVITTSNSAVHVAGAQNVPTWLLLPHGRGTLWYWFLDRSDSPWYPALKIFRATGANPEQPWEIEPARAAAAALVQAKISS